MNTDEVAINAITERIIGCAYRVARQLGHGFLEKCYENAMALELRKLGLHVQQQQALNVWYDGVVVGEYVADLIIDGKVLIELKSIQSLDTIHVAQCINYLAATRLPICLLINFSRRVQIRRIVGPTMNSTPSSVSISAPSVAKKAFPPAS